jgi:hypothetical protein
LSFDRIVEQNIQLKVSFPASVLINSTFKYKIKKQTIVEFKGFAELSFDRIVEQNIRLKVSFLASFLFHLVFKNEI